MSFMLCHFSRVLILVLIIKSNNGKHIFIFLVNMSINSVNDRASFDGIRRLINLVEIYTNIGTRVVLKYYGLFVISFVWWIKPHVK